MKRILFLIQDTSMPSSRVRVLNLVPELEKSGLSCTVEAYPRCWTDKARLFRQVRAADIVVVQKKLPSPPESALLATISRRLVFDFDDAIYCRHESGGASLSRSRIWKFNAIVSRADLVIAGNAILRERAALRARCVALIPSAVEVSSIPVKRPDATGHGPVVLGWVGGRINLGHLVALAEPLRNLASRHAIEVHVVCDRGCEIPGVKVVHVPWTLDGQAQAIARFDIGLMPLPDTEHARGKCGYKALQCMAAGVPVVVSDVGSNRDIVRDGMDGYVVPDNAAFTAAVERLIVSPADRARMGRHARQRVEEGYSIERIGGELARALASL